MMTGPRICAAAAFLPLIACAGQPPVGQTVSASQSGSAGSPSQQTPQPQIVQIAGGQLRTAAGEPRGEVRVTHNGATMRVAVQVNPMPPGTYGVHVHALGRCDGPAFTTAGPHWNPTTRQHGRLNPQGTHHGDLPNLVVGADGSGRFEADLPGSSGGEGGLMDADGASLVVHARADDERTDPSGNSGDRIACAVLNPIVYAPAPRR
jgi:superoxide dismutase, Cu-Zn family